MQNEALEALDEIETVIQSILDIAHKNGVTELAAFKFKEQVKTIRTALEQAQEERAAVRDLAEVLKRIKLEILDQNGQEFYEDEFPFIEKALTTHAEAIKRAGGE
tara:strand:- start:309 stop:623 length:315 start_codon:yes stop_codon:yes gene_type:complete